jgi:hypothetical protein
MTPGILTEVFDAHTKAAYDVRINGTVFIWGSASLTTDLTFDKPLLLHIRNDLYGVPVALGTQNAAGTVLNLGSIGPGEGVTIPVQTISGVFATCAAGTDTILGCLINA